MFLLASSPARYTDNMPASQPPTSNPSPTWDTCHAVNVWFTPLMHVIVWRDSPSQLRLIHHKRMRDVRPGDDVEWQGERRKVLKVEVYR